MASNDDVVLKEQIRELKVKQQIIKEEKMKLEKSIYESDLKCNALKMEANILAALDEVRFQDIDEPVASQSVHDDVTFSRQFLEKNLKLELEILNAELRQSLPKLEKEAIRAEDKANKSNEDLQICKKEIEKLPIISAQELEEKEEELMRTKQLLCEKIDKVTKEAIKERSSKQRTVIQLRKKVSDIDDEISFEKDRAYRLKKLLLDEQGRVEYLRNEHKRLREQLSPYHDGKGWQTEAFIGYTSAASATINSSELPFVLKQWLPTDIHGITPDTVQDALRKIGMEDKQDLTCDEFVSLCDALNEDLIS